MFKLMAIYQGKPVEIASFKSLKAALTEGVLMGYYKAWYVIG